MNIFGRITNVGDVMVSCADTGGVIKKLDDSFPTVYPIGSDISANYEHSDGIFLTVEDAEKIGLEIVRSCGLS